MTTLTVYLIMVLWYACGVAGFLYWWTQEYDFTTREIFIAAVLGIAGPLTFIIGAAAHGNARTQRTLLKRKKNRES